MTDLEKRILDLRKRYGDYLTQREFMEAAGISSRTAYLANEPDVLSIRQASRITGFHKNSIAKWIQCGYLRSFRWKGDYRISKTEVLMIDDFGIERIKDWIEEKLYRIINARYINRRITSFTSNMPIDRLEYDDRITNRIKERSYPLVFPGESVRDYIAEDNLRRLKDAMI